MTRPSTNCITTEISHLLQNFEMQERYPSIDHWMIGRGLISDPFLPSMIKIIRRNIHQQNGII
jgi:hypothetical protein